MLVVIIILDLALMGGATYVLLDRIQTSGKPGSNSKVTEAPAAPAPPLPQQQAPVNAPPVPPPELPKTEIKRRILFSVRAAKARRVQIVGDFTQWKPESLSKGRNHIWSAVIPLSPGVYTYNYVINQKRKIKDPNNPHTTADGKSVLTVKGNQ